jgi:PAS domain S-box-containing protein
LELVYPDDRHILENILSKDLVGNRVSVEARCLTKSGEPVHYLLSGTSFTQNGETFIVGGGLNRNDIKEIEHEKNRNTELLNQLFFNSPIGIALVNTDGTVKTINNSFEKIFGYSELEIEGKDLNKTIVPEYMDEQGEAFSHLSFIGDSFQSEATRLRKNGEEVPVLIGGVPVEIDGEVIAIYGMYVDISERKQLENRIVDLLETEKKARLHMEDMFEEAPSAIAMLEGSDHTYTFVNETYKKLVGKSELTGSTVKEAIPELAGQGLIQLLDDCYSEGKPFFFYEKEVYFNKDSEKNVHYLNFVYKPLRDEDGDVYGIFVQAIDVTEQVQARNIIEKSLAEKNTLLGEVHHRVKNNLAIISGLLELDLMGSENKDVIKHLTSTQSRITSIAKIHELLYQNESLSHVNFKNYMESMLVNQDTEASRIFDAFELENVTLNVNQAIPAGMLLNEIISCLSEINSRIYGGGPCRFTFSMDQNQNCVTIQLKEGDRNILKHFNTGDESENKLRYELIEVLLRQIEGQMKIQNDVEDILTISFAKREVKGPHSAINN